MRCCRILSLRSATLWLNASPCLSIPLREQEEDEDERIRVGPQGDKLQVILNCATGTTDAFHETNPSLFCIYQEARAADHSWWNIDNRGIRLYRWIWLVQARESNVRLEPRSVAASIWTRAEHPPRCELPSMPSASKVLLPCLVLQRKPYCLSSQRLLVPR